MSRSDTGLVPDIERMIEDYIPEEEKPITPILAGLAVAWMSALMLISLANESARTVQMEVMVCVIEPFRFEHARQKEAYDRHAVTARELYAQLQEAQTRVLADGSEVSLSAHLEYALLAQRVLSHGLLTPAKPLSEEHFAREENIRFIFSVLASCMARIYLMAVIGTNFRYGQYAVFLFFCFSVLYPRVVRLIYIFLHRAYLDVLLAYVMTALVFTVVSDPRLTLVFCFSSLFVWLLMQGFLLCA